MNILVYGPPGAGKSAVGQSLAARLGREFVDTDTLIESRTGLTVAQVFAQRGEAEFRRLETEVCAGLAARQNLVIAPGGGALLNASSRTALERGGLVVCLRASTDELSARLERMGGRPLLAGRDARDRLEALLEARRELYASFPLQIDTTGKNASEVVDDIMVQVSPRRLTVRATHFEHDLRLGYGLFDRLPTLLTEDGLDGSAVVVTDENVAGWLPVESLSAPAVVLPSGEAHKNLDTVRRLYDAFLAHGLDRRGVVIAIGGGVVGDIAGYAAATYMRGIRWVNVPTTLLAMVDASLGGKTGVDLPQGKNLVGAFHPPALVVSDPLTLNTLPEAERISGMAEVVKHGLIGDPGLLKLAKAASRVRWVSRELVERALRVKLAVVEADPFERGERAKLNLGHTIGHGIEAASGYRLRHGEAVAIGLVAEADLSERLGIAEPGLCDTVEAVVQAVGLPVRYQGLEPAHIREMMSVDKKRVGGELKFALPVKVGEVRYGIGAPEGILLNVLEGRQAA